MGLGQTILPSLVILAAFGCAPPLLSLLVCRKRWRHARARGRPAGWAMGMMLFSAAAFILNLALLSVSAILLSNDPGWTRLQAAMLLMGWVCFWLWVLLILTGRAKRRRVQY